MGFLTSHKEKDEKIKLLQDQIAELDAKLAQAEENDNYKELLSQAESRIDLQNEEISQLQAKIATFDEEVEKKAVELVAAKGHAPLETQSSHQEQPEYKTLNEALQANAKYQKPA